MDKFVAAGLFAAKADLGAAGLKIPAGRAGADLQPFAASGCPDLNIVLGGGLEAEVARTHPDYAKRQSQPPAYLAGVFDQGLQFDVRVVGMDQLDHLDLVELMAPLD